ncbi:hypothetical protein [Oscillatoria salina]|uniref:hypothetical protein n=1 Tax=Oscillatoria salina TaxID=331517 RepID=UPI001CCBB054|nr:hypothetical protein [Oscillatoria salina]MBZ8179213.1 hypothetical protein [Oscillatoria salina IIICB1]
MTTYYEVLNQVQNLTPDEQLRLLEELASIARHRLASNVNQTPPVSQKWQGFLLKCVDGLDFQRSLRREWD